MSDLHRAAPITDRVEWHEGMLLSPQHFQQFSARMDTLVAWQTLAAAPFAWGVRRGIELGGRLFRFHLTASETEFGHTKLDGDRITFNAEQALYTGRVTSNGMEGTISTGGEWKAVHAGR